MRYGVQYPRVLSRDPETKRGEARIRALADRATAVRGTHRQKVKIAFFDAAICDDMLRWGDRPQRRAAERARGLRARGYQAVP